MCLVSYVCLMSARVFDECPCVSGVFGECSCVW